MAYGSIKVDSITSSTQTVNVDDLGVKANPTFTGTVTIPTPSANDNTTKAASTAYVQTELGDYALKAGPTFTGTVTAATLNVNGIVTTDGITIDGPYKQTAEAVAALAIDCATGNYFTKTIDGNSTFTVSNVPTSGTAYAFILELTHTSGTITWFSGVEWPAATAPTLTTGKTHLFIFQTDNGGTRWRASSLVDYTN
tara:strand:+ start:838 stop:1428 length:591 start_codon:yes stop_codon:yes gene_type:complete